MFIEWRYYITRCKNYTKYITIVIYNRGAQIPGATSPWRVHFVRWRLILVGAQVLNLIDVTCLAPRILRWQLVFCKLKWPWYNVWQRIAKYRVFKLTCSCAPNGRWIIRRQRERSVSFASEFAAGFTAHSRLQVHCRPQNWNQELVKPTRVRTYRAWCSPVGHCGATVFSLELAPLHLSENSPRGRGV
jgi:hypothetical protein